MKEKNISLDKELNSLTPVNQKKFNMAMKLILLAVILMGGFIIYLLFEVVKCNPR